MPSYREITDVDPGFAQEVLERHRSVNDHFAPHEISALSEAQYLHVIDSAAQLQRVAPENQMNVMQHRIGGGVYSHGLEHIGDLYHRIGEIHSLIGLPHPPGTALQKIESMHRMLNAPYGFEREHRENIAGNRAWAVRQGKEYPSDAEISEMGEEYARRHYQLPSYNRPLHQARRAARSLGLQKFDTTRSALLQLRGMSASPEDWHRCDCIGASL